MVERPMIGVRVPQEWKADLETIAARTGQTLSQMLYDSVAQYLDRETVNSVNRFVEPVNHQATEVLLGQVLTVLTGLSKQVQEIKGLEARVAETVAGKLQTVLTGFTRQTEAMNTETAAESLQTALTEAVKPIIPHNLGEQADPLASEIAKKLAAYNQQKALDAERRIKAAIAALKSANNFPSGKTARVNAIMATAHCGKQTLQKYKELWHPDYDGLSTTQTEPPSTLSKTEDSHHFVKQAFTTGEAYKLLCEERGFLQSKSTFKRRLTEGLLNDALPDELEALGLVADFELRRHTKPTDNTLQWLSFKD